MSRPSAAEPPESVAVESDLVVILAALLCALICVVGLIAVARCAWLRRTATTQSAPPPTANKGLKKKVLHSLPTLSYGSAVSRRFAADCAICLAEFVEGDELRVLPQCGHGFHVRCVDTWLESHSSCPSCRKILVVSGSRCQKCSATEAELKGRQDQDPNDFLP